MKIKYLAVHALRRTLFGGRMAENEHCKCHSGADTYYSTRRDLFRSCSRWQIYWYNIYILYTIYITIHIVHILYWLYHYIYIMCFVGSILWICREFEPSPHSLTGCLHRNSEVESGLSYGRADAQQRLLGSSAKVAISYAVEIQGQQRGQGFQIQHVVWWQIREVIPSINSKWCCNPPFFKASFQGIRWLFLNFFLSFL